MVECKCDCGKQAITSAHNLKKGMTVSCGCFAIESKTRRATIHGAKFSPAYQTWVAMKTRCTNPNDYSYRNYGGRGITICDRWKNSFKLFLLDMGHRPPGHTLDRINNDKGYEPGNCRWATTWEQSNNRRNNRIVEFRGEKMTMAQMCKLTGIPRGVVTGRLKLGWDLEKAATAPVKKVVRF